MRTAFVVRYMPVCNFWSGLATFKSWPKLQTQCKSQEISFTLDGPYLDIHVSIHVYKLSLRPFQNQILLEESKWEKISSIKVRGNDLDLKRGKLSSGFSGFTQIFDPVLKASSPTHQQTFTTHFDCSPDIVVGYEHNYSLTRHVYQSLTQKHAGFAFYLGFSQDSGKNLFSQGQREKPGFFPVFFRANLSISPRFFPRKTPIFFPGKTQPWFFRHGMQAWTTHCTRLEVSSVCREWSAHVTEPDKGIRHPVAKV